MSNTPIKFGAAWPGIERRREIRTQLGALIYLDIGSDNGGIVTDLTEGGAGVQVVSPLEALAAVAVQFQLPNSKARIEASAHVVWVSESRKHAGLRFLDVAEELRAQIRNSISAAAADSAVPTQEANAQEPPRREVIRDSSRKDKWSTLLANTSAPEQEVETPRSKPADRPAAREIAPKPEVPTTTPLHGFLREIALAKQSHPLRAVPRLDDVPARTEHPGGREDPGSVPAGPSVPTGNQDGVIHWPAAAYLTQQKDEHTATEPASPIAPASPPIAANSRQSLLAEPKSASESIARANRVWQIWKWVVIGIGSCVLCVASFGVGRWLGGSGAVQPAPEARSIAIPKDVSGAAAQPKPTAIDTANARAPIRRETRDVASKPTPTNAEIAPPIPAPSSSTLKQTAPAAPPPQPRSAPTIFIPAESKSEPANADHWTQGSAVPSVVNGRVLGPMDRFNPAHLTYRFDPDYPLEAKAQNVEGTVALHIEIGSNGSVGSVKPLSGPPMLVPAAVAAVKNWQFLPALLNGQPVESEQDVSVEFRLPHSEEK